SPQVERVAFLQRVVLGLPVPAEDSTVDQPQCGSGALSALDEVLERHERTVLPGLAPVGEAAAWFPRGNRGLAGEAGHRHPADPAFAWLDLVLTHDPRVDARTGRDGRPDLLRAGFQVDVVGQLELVRHCRTPQSLVRRRFPAGALILGWMATMTR